MKAPRLVMVDDEPEFGTFVRAVGESAGFAVDTAKRAEEFKAALARGPADVIILDVSMPDTDGIELLRWLSEQGTRAKVLIMSGFDARMRQMALELGRARGLDMAGVIAKPVRAAELRSLLSGLAAPS
jgi:DNA-binding response OmpR family regulator